MRSDLDHLPAGKQRDLERVVQMIFEEGTSDWKQKARVVKILLYGSYARGTWVDEPQTAKGYQSDFDLLIIVNDARLNDRIDYWSALEDRLMREFAVTKGIRTPVNFIVHSLQEVNDGLAQGRYFFMDIARDGIALYQSDDSDLARPRPKTPEASLALAKEYFEEWMPAAQGMLETAKFSRSQLRFKDAAFLYHQTAERLYHCVLLVVTFYTPHVHNLAFLRTQAERLDRRLCYVWPQDTREQRARFAKLKEAYVKARYSKHYRISDEELAWLSEQVEELGRIVHVVCSERLALLASQVEANR